MRMTVREAFEKKVKQPGLRLMYQGNVVYQLKRPYPGATRFVVQFDDRGLPPAYSDGNDLIEVEG